MAKKQPSVEPSWMTYQLSIFQKYHFDTAVNILFAQAALRIRLHILNMEDAARIATRYGRPFCEVWKTTQQHSIYR